MEALAALIGGEPATAGRAVVEEAWVLTILLAELRVQLFLLLRTLRSEIGVGQMAFSFATVLALSFTVFALSCSFTLWLPFLLLPVLLPPLLLTGATSAASAAPVLARRADGCSLLRLALHLRDSLLRLLAVLLISSRRSFFAI